MNSAAHTADIDSAFPLRHASKEDFDLVKSSLHSPDFNKAHIQDVLESHGFRMPDSEVPEKQDSQVLPSETRDRTLIKLFVHLETAPRSAVEQVLGREALDAFLSLDLLRIHPSDDSQYYSPVFLYPVGDFLIVSDHYRMAGGLLPDSVFPAVEPGTARLSKLLPQHQIGEALDLCSGTGILAFFLSRHAQHVVASDITARATHFARFNRLLNSCDNVEVLQG